MCGVTAHFVGEEGKIQNVLLSLIRMLAGHAGVDIAEVIIDALDSYGIVDKLGVYVADNADSNDTAWKEVLRRLYPGRVSNESRSRCLGHIINSAAKAILFGRNVDAFEGIVG